MGVNKFNCEGYYDPTAYEALTKIEQEAKALRAFRPVVYICSPLAGDMVKNQENARTYCRFAVDAGCVPIAPHIYFTQFMNDTKKPRHSLSNSAPQRLNGKPRQKPSEHLCSRCRSWMPSPISTISSG